MSNENEIEPMGGPEPVAPKEGRRILKQVSSAVALVVGGIVSVALFATPTRTCGATRSAKLKWQQRDREIREAIQSAAPCQSGNVAKQPQAPPPVLENDRDSKK